MPSDPDGFVMTTSFVQNEGHGLQYVTSGKEDVGTLIHLAHTSGDSCHWHRILRMIHRNPSCLTQQIFFKALHRNPPEPVVLQMLRVAPLVASLPPSGPTALQVALQSGASLGVIRALLEVSPFALCVTRSFEAIDPLSYASKWHIQSRISWDLPFIFPYRFLIVEQFRAKETELIELLNLPLSYWLSHGAFHPTEGRAHPNDAGEVIPKPAPSPSVPTSHKQPSLPPIVPEASTATNVTSLVDRQELNNVKCLCAQVLKGHKRLAKQLELCQTQLQSKVESSSAKTSSAAQRVLETLKEEQNKQFQIQLIALDMKERAFDARAKQVEERCLDQVDEQLAQLKETHENSLRTQNISELTMLMDHKVSMDEKCHRDLLHHMQAYRLKEKGNQVGQEVILWEKNHFPGFFPMNLAELEECTPLNITSTSLSDDNSENSDTAEPLSRSRRRTGIGRFRSHREPSVRKCFLSF